MSPNLRGCYASGKKVHVTSVTSLKDIILIYIFYRVHLQVKDKQKDHSNLDIRTHTDGHIEPQPFDTHGAHCSLLTVK